MMVLVVNGNLRYQNAVKNVVSGLWKLYLSSLPATKPMPSCRSCAAVEIPISSFRWCVYTYVPA